MSMSAVMSAVRSVVKVPRRSYLHESRTSLNNKEELFSSPSADAPDDLLPALKEIWDYYPAKTNRDPKVNSFSPLRRRKGLARLKGCIAKTTSMENAVKVMKIAIDATARSDFHTGRDPKTNGLRYNSWENNIFKNLRRGG
jgi:hypothetical protein